MKISKLIAVLLVLGGLSIIGFIFGPVIEQEFRYQTSFVRSTDQEIVPVSTEFGLVIPKLEVNVEVFANVDDRNSDEYLPILNKGVAHAKGSHLPDYGGNVFIFAHSANSPLNINRFNAVFYLINKLDEGDEVFVYYQDEKYRYQVEKKKILPPEEVPYYLSKIKGSALTLQTCHPPGTTINRLLVVAKEIE